MSYQIDYDPRQGFVRITVEGILTMSRLLEIVPQAAATCEANQCRRILNDMRRAEPELSVMDVYTSPQRMEEAKITRQIRRALVMPPSFDKRNFLENVLRNRGHNLRVFTDYDAAQEWLLQD